MVVLEGIVIVTVICLLDMPYVCKLLWELAGFIDPTDDVLECACGTGAITVCIAEKCRRLIATDLSSGMLRPAARKCRKYSNVRFRRADITSIKCRDDRFDKVVAGNVIHLLPDPGKAFSELERVVKPGGEMIIPTYINMSKKSDGLAVKFIEFLGADFKKQFDLESYKLFFEKMGYDKVEYHVVEGRMPCAIAVIKKDLCECLMEWQIERRGAEMFREMRRFKQQISEEECIRVLKEQPRGVLSMIGDDGYPYGIPMNHLYMEDGHLYFHGAREGHKLDAIAKCDKVSYCVYDQGYRKEGEWSLNINSVVVFGRIRVVEDEEKKREICTLLCRKFTDDEEYLQKELTNAFPRVNCLELIPEHMTGKLVNEA